MNHQNTRKFRPCDRSSTPVRFLEELAYSTDPKVALKHSQYQDGGQGAGVKRGSEDSECYKHGKRNEKKPLAVFPVGKESAKPAGMHALRVKCICWFLRLRVTFLN